MTLRTALFEWLDDDDVGWWWVLYMRWCGTRSSYNLFRLRIAQQRIWCGCLWRRRPVPPSSSVLSCPCCSPSPLPHCRPALLYPPFRCLKINRRAATAPADAPASATPPPATCRHRALVTNNQPRFQDTLVPKDVSLVRFLLVRCFSVDVVECLTLHVDLRPPCDRSP